MTGRTRPAPRLERRVVIVGRGHIPSAVNIPFSTLADAANKLKDSAMLKSLLSDAGIKQGDQIVSYCHIGQQATLVYFVAKYLGYDARLYDGSFEDWSKRTELPVVTGNKQ